jgi:signal transduction histidine kinase
MSHELRTPMNAILGFSELLIDKKVGELSAKQLDYLNDIHASADHLLRLINDVLDIAKIESGKSVLNVEEFDITDTIEEVIKVLTPIAAKKRVAISIELTPEVNTVSIDKKKFRQILYNLISNAIKFNIPDGTVHISTEIARPGFFQMKVTDTGVGISKEDIGKLFIPFVQIDSGTTRRHEGTGLGLALTRNIIELHGGEIKVDSQSGMGSTFCAILPLDKSEKI